LSEDVSSVQSCSDTGNSELSPANRHVTSSEQKPTRRL